MYRSATQTCADANLIQSCLLGTKNTTINQATKMRTKVVTKFSILSYSYVRTILIPFRCPRTETLFIAGSMRRWCARESGIR